MAMTDQNNEARDMGCEALSLMFKGDLRRIGWLDDEIDALEGLSPDRWPKRQDRQTLTGICLFRGANIRLPSWSTVCSLLTVNKLISVLWCWGKPLLLILTRLLIPSFD
jgi:hypothetical protein